jgi:hypothetical protein
MLILKLSGIKISIVSAIFNIIVQVIRIEAVKREFYFDFDKRYFFKNQQIARHFVHSMNVFQSPFPFMQLR